MMGLSHDKMQFAFSMAKHTSATMWDVERLLRYGATYGRIAMDMCNGPDYDRCRNDEERKRVATLWQAYQDTLPAKAERIKAHIKRLGFSIHFQNDPRGHTVRVIPGNQFVSEIPVPTS